MRRANRSSHVRQCRSIAMPACDRGLQAELVDQKISYASLCATDRGFLKRRYIQALTLGASWDGAAAPSFFSAAACTLRLRAWNETPPTGETPAWLPERLAEGALQQAERRCATSQPVWRATTRACEKRESIVPYSSYSARAELQMRCSRGRAGSVWLGCPSGTFVPARTRLPRAPLRCGIEIEGGKTRSRD